MVLVKQSVCTLIGKKNLAGVSVRAVIICPVAIYMYVGRCLLSLNHLQCVERMWIVDSALFAISNLIVLHH
jgi:hypothetical protein